jgi:hypothetical protein
MSWGYKILIGYVLFVGLMLALVFGSYQHKVNLVSKDYYEQELVYQAVIDGSKNYAAQEGRVAVELADEHLTIQLPHGSENISYKNVHIWLYNKVESGNDIRVNLPTSTDNAFELALDERHRGNFLLKVQWEENDMPFYFEKDLRR